jgi:uncharacterized coiled-coil DUF342 family protein
MLKAERTQRLKDLVQTLEELMSEFDRIKTSSTEVNNAIDYLEDVFNNNSCTPYDFDNEQLKIDACITLIKENTNIEQSIQDIKDFQDEFESFKSEQPDHRQERLEEYYADLEIVIDLLDDIEPDNIESFDMDEITDKIKEIQNLLEGMY